MKKHKNDKNYILTKYNSRVDFVYDNLLNENMTNKKLKIGNHYFVVTGILHKQYKLYVYYTMYMQVFQ